MRHADVPDGLNELTGSVVDACIAVHRELGPGFKEAHYEEALCIELRDRGVPFERQKRLTLRYKAQTLARPYRMDLFVDGRVVVEVKAVEALMPIHLAQLASYLRAAGAPVGLLINFNARNLAGQIRRVVAPAEEPNEQPSPSPSVHSA